MSFVVNGKVMHHKVEAKALMVSLVSTDCIWLVQCLHSGEPSKSELILYYTFSHREYC